jgi:ApbE superfamily uncharacterized protein (UPF0280 family)
MAPSSRAHYQPRTYRRLAQAEGLVGFEVTAGESDLWIWAERDLRAAAAAALQAARAPLVAYARQYPAFLTSLVPLSCPPSAPGIVQRMCAAAERAGVGPMAAVAGAIAQQVAAALRPLSGEVIVENGGDIYLFARRPRIVAVVAPGTPLSGRLGLRIPAGAALAVCTSSGTHGHSLSFGRADAAVLVAHDGALADALATAVANRVREPKDLEKALTWAKQVEGFVHGVVICASSVAAVGELELVPLGGQQSDVSG